MAILKVIFPRNAYFQHVVELAGVIGILRTLSHQLNFKIFNTFKQPSTIMIRFSGFEQKNKSPETWKV